MPNVAVVIPAGGRGKRMGGTLPKQFLRVGGITILERTVAAFHAVREVGEIVLVVPAAFVPRTVSMVRRGRFVKVTAVVKGGKERQDSVRNGLRACRGRTDLVLVHDAVRPLIQPSVIRTVIRETERYGAAVVGTKVKDTIKIESTDRQGFTSTTPPREGLWAVQTPQGFRFDLLWRAHQEARSAGFQGTDEASLVERLGVPVRIVLGSETNIKITTSADRKLAEILIKGRL
jgi:2-C-methyl-D-erythritol 4-phosphate cytidylyltransferase